jgi:GNAT superfamily N-acetyltransferase
MSRLDPAQLRFEARSYDDHSVTELVEVLQGEYVRRYGSRDDAAVDPGEFAPPHGLFLLALAGAEPVAMGGWRHHGPGVVEIKRMFVPEALRRRGLARRLLVELEDRAAASGAVRVILNTGREQPEAVAMYEAMGYEPELPFGHYAGAPLALFFGKDLFADNNTRGVSG